MSTVNGRRTVQITAPATELGVPCCTAKLERGLFGFYCTRKRGHEGDHVAHGGKGEELARWSEGKEVVKP